MTIYENDKVVEKKLISKEYYRPRKEVIKKRAKQPIEEENNTEDDSDPIN